MCLLIVELCPLCEQKTGTEYFRHKCFESQVKIGCQDFKVEREVAPPENLPTIQCKTEECMMNKEASFKCDESWEAAVEKVVEEVVNQVANVPEPMDIDQEDTVVADTNPTSVDKLATQPTEQPKLDQSVNKAINKPITPIVPVESLPSASSGEQKAKRKAKRKAVDEGNGDAKRVATSVKPTEVDTLNMPEGAAQTPGSAPSSSTAARPPIVDAAAPVVVVSPATIVTPAASKGDAKIAESAAAKPAVPSSDAPLVKRTIKTMREVQYRAIGTSVDLEDLDDDVLAELRDLQKKMNDRKASEPFTKRRRGDLWLLEEDIFLQFLKRQGFPYPQMSREFMLGRSPPSLTIRRLTHEEHPPKGFVYIPDGPKWVEVEEVIEVPAGASEAEIADLIAGAAKKKLYLPTPAAAARAAKAKAKTSSASTAGAAKGKAGKSPAETQPEQAQLDLHPTVGAQLERGSVEVPPQSQFETQVEPQSVASAASSAASTSTSNGNGTTPAKRPHRIIVMPPWGKALAAQPVQLPLANPVPIGQVPAPVVPKLQAEPQMGLFPSPPVGRRSPRNHGGNDTKGKGKAPASPMAMNDSSGDSTILAIDEPKPEPEGKGKGKGKGKAPALPMTTNNGAGPSTSADIGEPGPKAKPKPKGNRKRSKAKPKAKVIDDSESDCSDSDILPYPCYPACTKEKHYCPNFVDFGYELYQHGRRQAAERAKEAEEAKAAQEAKEAQASELMTK